MAGLSSDERKKAYALFCEKIDRDDESLRPSALPFRYDPCPLVDRVVWRVPGVELMINEELRELTNEMNRWKLDLGRWNAWADVLDEFPEEAAWHLRVEFVGVLVFFCMFQPAATRDRLSLIATNAVHQARMARSSEVVDWIGSAPLPGKRATSASGHFMEQQLERLSAQWPGSKVLMQNIRLFNENSYISATANFRNLASHAIAPRLGFGITSVMRRVIEVPDKLVPPGANNFKVIKLSNVSGVLLT
jgi:hypothetical protein